ncbi:MAG TPA: BON domain-containing protein [Halanaerobiales bacterium]|nr:BON domain-containing protein [Halanaerobiales bacterium]
MIFGKNYNDELLQKEAKNAIEEQPTLRGIPNINVTSDNGIVSIFGSVRTEELKKDIKKIIENKYDEKNIDYKEIQNDLTI